MTDSEFNTLADALLRQIEAALERSEADLDFESVGSNVLQIEFSDRSKIVVNRHDAAKEIWVAARSGGFHYRWNGRCWQDTRHDEELLSALSRLVSEQAGERVSLAWQQ
jgi:CyaY protein